MKYGDEDKFYHKGLALLYKGRALFHQSRFDEALMYLNEATKCKCDNHDNMHMSAYHKMGMAFYAQRKFSEAIDPLTKAIGYKDYFPSCLFYRSKAYQQTCKNEQALIDFQTVSKLLDPNELQTMEHNHDILLLGAGAGNL